MSQINLIIDSEDKNAVRAALAFFETLSGVGHTLEASTDETKKVKIAPVPEKVKEFVKEQAPKKTETVKEPEISLNNLRLLVAEKAKNHKPKIREWLEERGYTKTPEVPTELYPKYVEFLNTLS